MFWYIHIFNIPLVMCLAKKQQHQMKMLNSGLSSKAKCCVSACLQECCHAICLDSGIDYRRLDKAAAGKLYYL